MLRTLAVILLSLATVGCRSDGADEIADTQKRSLTSNVSQFAGSAGASLSLVDTRPVDPPPSDAAPEPLVRTRLDVYSMIIPKGTISLDDEFWKRVDETAISPEAYDVLYKNGVRVGSAPTSEWQFFRDLLARQPARSQQGDFAGEDGKAIEMSLQKDVNSQTIFFLDAANRLQGRSFDRCENLLSLSLYPLPRQPGAVRVAMVPLVRTLRTKMEFNTMNSPGTELQYVSPEYLYDLNLRAEIPAGRFLIVAPSREGRWPTSLGNVFFGISGAGEQSERVLLLVPKLVTLTPVRQ